MLRFIPAAILAVALLPSHVSAVAQTAPIKTVSATSHGILVSLTVPMHPYPLDALVIFAVTLENVSAENRYLQDFPPDYGGPFGPHVLMRKPSGALVYEEQLSQFLAPTPGTLCCDAVLHPGESRTWHIKFVLGAADVRAVTRVADGITAFQGRASVPTPTPAQWARHVWHIASPWLHLELSSEPAPTATVTRSGSRIHITVSARWPVSGPMFYMDSARCWFRGSVESVEQHVPWVHVAGTSFTSAVTAHCPSAQPYRAVIGWLNHRVLRLSYRSVSSIARMIQLL